jgi:multiple sugar transport system permease protein
MSDPLTISLIVLVINLIGLLVVYSLMASAIMRMRWHQRGLVGVLITILLAQVVWLIPAFIGFHYSTSVYWASFLVCFSNSMVSAFAVVILCQRAQRLPRQLEDSARMDGCGWWGILRHVVLPRIKRELTLIGLLIAISTAFPFLAAFINPAGKSLLTLFESLPSGLGIPPFEIMICGSFVMTLPVIVTFIVAKHYLVTPVPRKQPIGSQVS